MGATNTQPIQTQVTPAPAPPIPQAPQQPTSMPSWFTGNSGAMAPQQPQVAPTMSPAVMQEQKSAPAAGGLPPGFNPTFAALPMSGGKTMNDQFMSPAVMPGQGGPKSGGCGHDQLSVSGGQVMPQTLFSM